MIMNFKYHCMNAQIQPRYENDQKRVNVLDDTLKCHCYNNLLL